MKKIIIKMVILIVIILFIPYIITILFDGSIKDYNVIEEGSLTIIHNEGTSNVLLSLDKYIMGVIAGNIPIDYEEETLKAQAVIARTYVLKSLEFLDQEKDRNQINSSDIGLYYTNIDDMKGSWNTEEIKNNISKIEKALYATKDEVITYEGELITPLFFRTSSGETRSSLEVFGEEIVYLSSVKSQEDITSSEYMKITEETVEGVLRIISKYNSEVNISEENFFDEIVVTKRDSLGYIQEIHVGNKVLTGEEFANMLNLNSSNCYIENYEGKVRFICKGKGHGVGLSQFGANEMAKKGDDYKTILTYYYKNTNVGLKSYEDSNDYSMGAISPK